MTTPADIVNRALQEIAGQATVTGSLPAFDGSPAGVAAGILYTPMLQMLLRAQDPEFARTPLSTLIPIPGPPPGPAGAAWFTYPPDCLRLRQVVPPLAGTDPFDPQPVRWDVVENVGGRAIMVLSPANIGAAGAIYTTSSITENQFDPMFAESFVRALASELAMAIGGRPDFSREKLGESGQIGQADQGRDS